MHYFFANCYDTRVRGDASQFTKNAWSRQAFNASNALLTPIHYLMGTPATEVRSQVSFQVDTVRQYQTSTPKKGFLRRLFSFKGLAAAITAIPSLILGSALRGTALLSDRHFDGDLVTQLKVSKAMQHKDGSAVHSARPENREYQDPKPSLWARLCSSRHRRTPPFHYQSFKSPVWDKYTTEDMDNDPWETIQSADSQREQNYDNWQARSEAGTLDGLPHIRVVSETSLGTIHTVYPLLQYDQSQRFDEQSRNRMMTVIDNTPDNVTVYRRSRDLPF